MNMTDDNLKQKAKELKDYIAQGILKFKAETGIIPGVGIVVKSEKSYCSEEIIYVDVSVNVDL